MELYPWLLEALEREFESVRTMKESGQGSVCLIRHRATGKQLVLRRYRGSLDVYQTLLRYDCPGLPMVYEAVGGPEDNLVLEEFIQGDSMDALLKGALFTPGEARQITLQLCRALWVLHSLGAVHRDVKPENVILRGKEAVLIDFDAARFHKPEQRTDTVVLGTTGFAAPEQYGLSQTDGRADIYSLGILLNVMLTGEHPSRKMTSDRLGRIVERCIQVNPEKRYPDVLCLMQAL